MQLNPDVVQRYPACNVRIDCNNSSNESINENDKFAVVCDCATNTLNGDVIEQSATNQNDQNLIKTNSLPKCLRCTNSSMFY